MSAGRIVGARRGLSLLEVVIVTGVFALITVPLVNLLIGYYAVFNAQQATVAVNTSASMVVSEVRTAALQAGFIAASHAFSGVTRTSGASALVLQLPAVDSSGTTIVGSYDYVGFYASGTEAYRAIDAAVGSVRPSGTKRLSDTLYSLSFTYNNADPTLASSTAVDVVTNATTTRQGTTTQHLYEQIYLRNSTL